MPVIPSRFDRKYDSSGFFRIMLCWIPTCFAGNVFREGARALIYETSQRTVFFDELPKE
jgi:hypothetical protein